MVLVTPEFTEYIQCSKITSHKVNVFLLNSYFLALIKNYNTLLKILSSLLFGYAQF